MTTFTIKQRELCIENQNHPNFRVERSAEAGRQNPSENRERRVRRKKGGNDNSQRRQQRRRQQRRKKWRKGNGKKGRRQQRPDKRKNCACARQNSSTPSDDCLATALKYQIAVSAFLANLKRSENRSEFFFYNFLQSYNMFFLFLLLFNQGWRLKIRLAVAKLRRKESFLVLFRNWLVKKETELLMPLGPDTESK